MKDKSSNEKGGERKLKTKTYEKELRKRHVELVKLQEWVKHAGLKVCVVFEGRDHQGHHRAGEPARLSGHGAARADRA